MKKVTQSFWVLLFIYTTLAGFVNTSYAQDAQLLTPVTSFTSPSIVNSGAYNEVQWQHNGATFSSSSYTNCSGYTTGNTIRTGSNTIYFQVYTPNSTLNQIQVKIQSNSTTAANAIVAFSADAVTWTNFSELTLPANNANPSCLPHTVTAPVGAKYFRAMRVGFGGYTPTGTVGQTIRFFEIKAYVNLACSNPAITTQPSTSTQNVCHNGTATALTVATSASSPTYQWYSSNDAVNNTSGDDVTVGTNADNHTPSTATVGTKYYYCKISVSGGCSTTSAVSGAINILALPAISSQNTPAAQYGENFGSPNPLTVTATGAGLSYQWYSSTDAATNTTGDDLAVGTNSNSFTPPTTPQGILYYYCVVSGTCSPSVTSAISGAIEIVPSCTTPIFSVQPTDFQTECQSVGVLTLGTVVADQSPTYQWYSNATKTNTGGTSVGSGSGGSTDTYTPPSGTAGIFYYYCVATNAACPTASNAVEITVYPTNPVVSQNTPGALYAIGASASALTVTASGTSLSYQWYSSTDAATNTSGDDIAVGTNSNSHTPSTAAAGTKYYYCIVTAGCGTGTTAISGAIVVVAYAVGDFGSLGTANWGTTNANWRQWNGSAWATTPAGAPGVNDNVFILAGHTVTLEVSAKNCKNLTVDGTLKTNALVNSPTYVRINGTTVTVNTGGYIGSTTNPTGDNADGIGLDLFGTNITINGTGGSIYISRMKTNTSGTTVTVDHDMTINYHGTTNQGGHTSGFMPNSASVDNTTLTINSGKTLTFSPWSILGTTSTSNAIPAVNLTVNVNGTLTLQDSPAPNGGAVPTANSYIYGGAASGKTFTLNIGNGGVVNTPQIYPNGTVSGGGVGTGTDGVITITGTGQLNVSKTADFRKATQTVTGTGSFSLLNGATLRIGSADGIAASSALGHIQTSTRSFSTGANYSYEGTAAQSAGDGLPSSVNNLTINNTAGVTLNGNVSVNGVLALTNGKLATSANTVTVTTTGSSITGSSSSNYVHGNLARAVDAGVSTVAFPIGDAGAYAPLSFNFGAGNSAGNVTASTTTPGVPPATGSAPTGSGIDQTKYINRSWTLSSTIATPDYDATFTYIDPADVTGGANTAALIIAKNDAGIWSNPGVASSVSPTVSSVAGQTSFSTFYLGEAAPVACTNNTFSGTGNWSDGTKWSCGAPPASSDNVTIAASANATLDVDFAVAGTLTMTATSTLTVNPARTLSVSGTANFAGQSVTFKSGGAGTGSLGEVTGTVSGATNVTVERYVPNNTFRSWRLLSVPVTTSQTIRQAWQEGDQNPNPKDNNVPGYGTQITGAFGTQAAATAAGFDSTSVQAAMLRWNGAGWSNITSTNQLINNFSSYFLYIRGDRSLTVTGMSNSSNATTLRTKGTIFTGDQQTNVGANAFALVPNVYPSAINFTGLTRTAGVNNLFYIWDSKKLNGSSLGTYQTFSSTNSFNCMISGGSYTLGQPNTVIESGQSFFVTSGAAGSITLKESAKVNGTNGSLGFRPTVKSKIDTRLYNNNDEMIDANAVVFDASYNKATGEEDAPKMGNPGANLAVEANNKLLAIEGRQPVADNDIIQFRMWNLAEGNYKLEFAVSNMSKVAEEGMTAILEDNYLNNALPISLTEPSIIKFSVDANAASVAANRFRVVFRKANPVIGSKQGYSIAPNPVENGIVNITFTNQPAGEYSIRILGANGKLITVKKITHAGGTANQAMSLPAKLPAGTYMAEISGTGKEKMTQILLVK